MFVSEVEFMLHKKQLNRVIKIQELKLKLLEKEIKINKIDTRIQLTAMAAILKPSEGRYVKWQESKNTTR